MKKNYLLVFSLFLLSCSREEAKIEEKSHIINPSFEVEHMIGSWTYESYIINGVEYPYPHRENCTNDLFAFYNQEGKLYDYEEMINLNDDCATQNTHMVWYVNGDQIELFFGTQFVTSFTVLSVNETEFVVATNVDENASNEPMIIKARRHDPYGWFEVWE